MNPFKGPFIGVIPLSLQFKTRDSIQAIQFVTFLSPKKVGGWSQPQQPLSWKLSRFHSPSKKGHVNAELPGQGSCLRRKHGPTWEKNWKKENPMHGALLGAKISPLLSSWSKYSFYQARPNSTQTSCYLLKTNHLAPNYELLHTYHRFALFIFHKCLQKAGEIHLFKKTWGSYFPPENCKRGSFGESDFFHQTVRAQKYEHGTRWAPASYTISRVTPVTPITFGHLWGPHVPPFFCVDPGPTFFFTCWLWKHTHGVMWKYLYQVN